MKLLVGISPGGMYAYELPSFEVKRLVFAEVAEKVGHSWPHRTKPDFSKESISSLPVSLQDWAQDAWDVYENVEQYYQKRDAFLQRLKDAKTDDELNKVLQEGYEDELTLFQIDGQRAQVVELSKVETKKEGN